MWYIPTSKASSNSSRLRSWLLPAKGVEAPPARGTKRRVTTARLRPRWLLVSTSVGTSSQSDDLWAPSLTPMKYQTYSTVPNIAKRISKDWYKLDIQPMGDLSPSVATSSWEDGRPISNSLPDKSGTTTAFPPGWVAGSPEESNTKTHIAPWCHLNV